ncbi:MAG: helix-turn-helix domain-containing protein [Alkalilacustris sp.]
MHKGRPPRIDKIEIVRRLDAGEGPTAVARALGISRGTVYKARAAVRP